MSIQNVVGDLFKFVANATSEHVVIPHVCNDIGAWGSGFVVPLGAAYPAAKQSYKEWHDKQTWTNPDGTEVPFELGQVQFVKVTEEITVANMVGQHQTCWSDFGPGLLLPPVRYLAIAKALEQVANYCKKLHHDRQKIEVHCPKFGSGLAGGKWEVLEALLDEIVSPAACVIVYELFENK